MSLTPDEIKKIAHLARLSLTPEESANYADQLTRILDFTAQMNQLDTSGIEPLAHAVDKVSQRLREDLITEPDLRDKYQAIAPKNEAGFYLVPAVIE